jgi:hypothetical protein
MSYTVCEITEEMRRSFEGMSNGRFNLHYILKPGYNRNMQQYYDYEKGRDMYLSNINQIDRTKYNEIKVWHGTSDENIIKIIQSGFKPSLSYIDSQVHGKGTYFTSDFLLASQDDYACYDKHNYQYICLCKLLLGEICEGDENEEYPKISPSTLNYCDTMVDDMEHPNIFVLPDITNDSISHRFRCIIENIFVVKDKTI